MNIPCKHCGTEIQLSGIKLPRTVKCPKCRTLISLIDNKNSVKKFFKKLNDKSLAKDIDKLLKLR